MRVDAVDGPLETVAEPYPVDEEPVVASFLKETCGSTFMMQAGTRTTRLSSNEADPPPFFCSKQFGGRISSEGRFELVQKSLDRL